MDKSVVIAFFPVVIALITTMPRILRETRLILAVRQKKASAVRRTR